MNLSEADIAAIVAGHTGKRSARHPGAVEVRAMLSALAELEFQPGRASPLVKLCEAGASYGWRRLEASISPILLNRISPKAKARVTRDLRRNLERLTRPCLELEQTSFGLAMSAIGTSAEQTDLKLAERMFLGDKPSHRLFSLFKEFPVLARLWCQLITQWRQHVREVVLRFAQDRTALSRAFFGGRAVRTIMDFRCSLSDPHCHGLTVMELQFEAGVVIYKPRPGNGEWEWSSLLDWMNARRFRPRLRVARVLRRKNYCWMERITSGPCKSRPAARRFYERIGAIMAAAYLLKAVDCHRDNLIAAGEDPVLVDADALWHVSGGSKTHTPLDFLSRTGFFPNSNPRSLRSRSSVLSRDEMRQYRREMMNGFSKGWDCILGTGSRRRAFTRRIRRIQSHKRRWIYRATEQYAAIRLASIQPAALRSGIERHRLITRLCRQDGAASEVIKTEIDALKRLDIPYFVRASKERILLDKVKMPAAVREVFDVF